MNGKQKTTVGIVAEEVLAFTAGEDVRLDRALVEADCIGSAAHVTMLAKMPVTPRLFSPSQRRKLIAELVGIMKRSARRQFVITLADQDVHLAIERVLTERLGDVGKRIHTGRSRNDQVAVDLRLFGKQQLLEAMEEADALALALLGVAKEHEDVPMVGRTHMQPAMPSSVGLWASSFAEELMDDVALLEAAYEMNDSCPLGSAASYGVPLPIDRQYVSDLLGFARPAHNVLFANNSRGRIESVILGALSQVMLTLSRLAQDLMIYTMPEFGYFGLPPEFCTGSSIMPQKRNPDVLELVRARASKVQACAIAVYDLVKGLPTGYNRDLQEAKEPFMEGIAVTRASVRIMTPLVAGLTVNEPKLLAGFSPDVFATDRAVELVGQGIPFRDAYHYVKGHLHELGQMDPREAIARKTHLGATAGLDLQGMVRDVQKHVDGTRRRRLEWHKTISRLLGARYPLAQA
jgi:argininosuccinate lyase